MSAPIPTRSTTAEGTAEARMSFRATERRMRESTTIRLYHLCRAAPCQCAAKRSHRTQVESLRPDPHGRNARLESVRRLCTALLLVSLSARGEEIRIELGRGRPSARLEAPGGRVEHDREPLAMPARIHELVARAGQLRVDGQIVQDGAPVVFHPGASALRLDGRVLPGRLEVWADARGLVLVNALDLEEYVAAVVASEVPSGWPDAALQAQAVAARTFAVAQKIAQGPAARAPSGRAGTVSIETTAGERLLSAVELRQILGYTALPSLWFDVSVERGAAVFRGRGNGHGVGLCQWGARARAVRGESYRAILT